MQASRQVCDLEVSGEGPPMPPPSTPCSHRRSQQKLPSQDSAVTTPPNPKCCWIAPLLPGSALPSRCENRERRVAERRPTWPIHEEGAQGRPQRAERPQTSCGLTLASALSRCGVFIRVRKALQSDECPERHRLSALAGVVTLVTGLRGQTGWGSGPANPEAAARWRPATGRPATLLSHPSLTFLLLSLSPGHFLPSGKFFFSRTRT